MNFLDRAGAVPARRHPHVHENDGIGPVLLQGLPEQFDPFLPLGGGIHPENPMTVFFCLARVCFQQPVQSAQMPLSLCRFGQYGPEDIKNFLFVIDNQNAIVVHPFLS